MTAAFEAWLDRVAAGEKPTAENFARSAIGELPRVETSVRRLDTKIWGEGVGEEPDAAMATREREANG